MTALYAPQRAAAQMSHHGRRSALRVVKDALAARRYGRAVGTHRSMRSLQAEFERRGGQPGTLRRPC